VIALKHPATSKRDANFEMKLRFFITKEDPLDATMFSTERFIKEA
jgi:hypothetical protein